MTNDQMRREFYEMAGLDGQDTARAFNGNIGDWVYLNPMTQDLYRYWQAATLKANQWRPIADAPRDGTHVLIHGQFEGYGANRLAVGMWDGETWGGARPDGVVILDPDKWLPLPLTGTEQDKL